MVGNKSKDDKYRNAAVQQIKITTINCGPGINSVYVRARGIKEIPGFNNFVSL